MYIENATSWLISPSGRPIELMVLLTREAGKTRLDGILEIREAVDFCRYYAAEARRLCSDGTRTARGPFVCISPWNFPLAIFTGQIVAALVAGNPVIAKPAERTPLVAMRAMTLMHDAGIPAIDAIERHEDIQPVSGAQAGAGEGEDLVGQGHRVDGSRRGLNQI